MTDQSVADEENGGAVGFLQRWSRRKSGTDANGDEPTPERVAPEEGSHAEPKDDGDSRIDPRTGKRFDELTDADMPDPRELRPDSDVSAFFAKGVSQAVRLAALRTLWHSAKFNQVDLMAEYSGDFTGYQKLGNVVTHDMRRAVKREIDRARERQEALEASAREDAERRQAGAERHEARQEADPGQEVGQDDPSAAQHSVSNGPAGNDDGARRTSSGEPGGDRSGGEPRTQDHRERGA